MSACRRLLSALYGLALPFALGVVSVSPVYASGDICEPAWALDLSGKAECANIAALTPGNDTRVNLLLLLFDRHGLPSLPLPPVTKPILDWRDFRDRFAVGKDSGVVGFAVGEGSRCRSNDIGATTFEAAVKAANGLPPDELTALLAARAALKPDCAGGSKTEASSEIGDTIVRSQIGKSFATYLHGAGAFYRGDFDVAAKNFESLMGNADPWLADTAAYMVARTLVNWLQADAYDAYGEFKGSADVNHEVEKRAENSLDGYLKDHPNGRYAVSARGLLRRVAWLAGRDDALAALYSALLAKPASARGIDDVSLVQEIDSKLLPRLTPAMTKDPILLAVIDLKTMRKVDGNKDKAVPNLEAQRDAFGSATSLHEFLAAAAAFYVDGSSAPVIKGLSDDTRHRDGDYLWFSRQFLRGQALEAMADRNSRGFWRELFPGATRPLDQSTVELALALHEESHGQLKDVFATDSLVTNPQMRAILLAYIAGPALLRAEAHNSSVSSRERQVALFTLLYKELTRGAYADFLSDVESVPADAPVNGSIDPEGVSEPPLGLFTHGESAGEIGCPSLSATASHLERDPETARDRLCLAEFVRVNGWDSDPLDLQPAKGALGATPSLFPGPPYSRAVAYRAIIANKAASPMDRAYALHRAVRCYEATGLNHCGGPEVPKAERKVWYNTLKRDYPTSRWAKTLQYWW